MIRCEKYMTFYEMSKLKKQVDITILQVQSVKNVEEDMNKDRKGSSDDPEHRKIAVHDFVCHLIVLLSKQGLIVLLELDELIGLLELPALINIRAGIRSDISASPTADPSLLALCCRLKDQKCFGKDCLYVQCLPCCILCRNPKEVQSRSDNGIEGRN